MLSLKSKRNVKSQYALLVRRELEDNIKDIDDFIMTYFREGMGVVNRLAISEDHMLQVSSRTVSYNLLLSYPLIVTDYVFGDECTQREPEVVIEVYRPVPKYEKLCSITEMSVLGEDVRRDDVFFSMPVKRELAYIQKGFAYTEGGRRLCFPELEKQIMHVELWDELIHDVLQVEEELVIKKPFEYRRSFLSNLSDDIITHPPQVDHGVVCVRSDIYYAGSIGSYHEVVGEPQYRLKADSGRWLMRGSGAAGDKFYIVPKRVSDKSLRGFYLLTSEFLVMSSSSWCYSKQDYDKAKDYHDVRAIYARLEINVDDLPSRQLLIEFVGKVIDVGIRYSVWQLGTRLELSGQVYNAGIASYVDAIVPIPLVADFLSGIANIAAFHSAKFKIISNDESMLIGRRRFVVLKNYTSQKISRYKLK